jgi:CO/xanthine dehydrogenase Mo-binding subunit
LSKIVPSGPLKIGTSSPRYDAYAKVAGKEKYAVDYYADNQLWIGVKRAGVPHAVLGKIDPGRALKIPGVLKVLTYQDVKGSNRQGVIRKDQPVLVDSRIRHCGDALAIILAENKSVLRQAIDAIAVDYDLLPGVHDIDKALEDGAPLVHEDNPTGNILLHGELSTGSGLKSEHHCDAFVEACFETQSQEHAYLETESGWAFVDDSGKLVIVCSTQTPFRDRSETAEALGLDVEGVRIIAPYPGGAFGGKDGITVQTLLGLAALNSGGRPVKMCWDRQESFKAGSKRHSARMFYRLGAKRDGTLHFLDAKLYFDTGPYDHLGGVVATLAMEHAGGPYRIPNVVIQSWAVYTNNPIGGAFRGFGVAQATAAIEQMIDMLAQKLGMDPLQLRLKNALRLGDRNCVGKTISSSTGIVECLETIRESSLWRGAGQWKGKAGLFRRRGVGICAVMQASGYGPVVPDYANAKVELTSDGKICVYCGVVDMGQGTASTCVQIAGSILGQDSANMELVLPDTDRTLPSGSASASRCMYTFGNALIKACNELKNRILQKGADLLMASSSDELVLIPGAVRHLPSGKEAPLTYLSKFFGAGERTALGYFRAPTARDILNVHENIRLHGMPHTLFSYGAQLACIEVDELTGSVEVIGFLSVTDCGKVINRQLYDQQIHGGIAQGIGYALTEELLMEQGRILNKDYSTYLIPTSMDIPDLDTVAVEIYEHSGPYGLKGVGEISVNGPLPAIANALADACGIRIFKTPLTPERVLEAMAGINTGSKS